MKIIVNINTDEKLEQKSILLNKFYQINDIENKALR